MYWESMRSYFKLARAHTAPLEMVPAAGGALLATGGQLSVSVVLWTVYGLLYHFAGYSMNSWFDFYNGYDKDDPHKQHHPLNNGEMFKGEAKALTWGTVGVTVIYLISLLVIYTDTVAIGTAVVGVLAGYSYNQHGKETYLKAVPISIAHTTVFVVPYTALGGNIFSAPAGVIAAIVFFWVFFQISVSGEIKDMEHDEKNIVRMLGMNGTLALAVGLRLTLMILGMIYLTLEGGSRFGYATVFLASLASIGQSAVMVMDYRSNRDKALSDMAIIELLSIITFFGALSPSIGAETVIVFILGSFAWVVCFNKYQWGTLIRPQV